jgi:hypothetical protein
MLAEKGGGCRVSGMGKKGCEKTGKQDAGSRRISRKERSRIWEGVRVS